VANNNDTILLCTTNEMTMCEPTQANIPVATTIAGSDSGGGAGIQADLKTFAALGVYGTCAITAITAQNTVGVQQAYPLPPELVAAQIDSIISDLPCHAAKTGMLATAAIIEVVADRVRHHNIPHLVVDPVMVATSGGRLLLEAAEDVYIKQLFPLAEVITPNAAEASVLLGQPIESIQQMRQAAAALCQLGPRAAVITGGHLSDNAVDIVYDRESDDLRELSSPHIDSPGTHGSGCIFSSAVAAYLIKGSTRLEAITQAKQFTRQAIQAALPIGAGPGPVNPGTFIKK